MAHDIAEISPLPRSRTLSYYVVLVCLVAPLWSSVLASWAFVIHSLKSGHIGSFAWPGRIAFAVTLCEVSHRNDVQYQGNINLTTVLGLLQYISL